MKKKSGRWETCELCSTLKDIESGFQIYGREEKDTYIPGVYLKFKVLADFYPYSSRKNMVLQCPECNTYYHFTSDYEYLTSGTEDEQELKRISKSEADELIKSHSQESQ